MSGYFDAMYAPFKWREPVNVPNPIHYTDDFAEDRGYFREDNARRDWHIESGMLTTDHPDGITFTYLHIYEKNVTVKARMRFRDINPPDSIFGIMLRATSEDAFVRFGCYVKSGIWFVDSREGRDFIAERHLYSKHEVDENRWYDIEFTVDGERVKLTVDGEVFVDCGGLCQLTPGRVAFYAHRLSVDVDSVDAAFLSGEGRPIPNIHHTKLPVDDYMEGGSVWEMSDGRLIYEHYSGTTFESADHGESWHKAEKWTVTHGYPNILRLRNGQFLKMTRNTVNGVGTMECELSDDDGKTWTRGGVLCETPFRGIPFCNAGNMNDKVTQISTGRIFYSMNYEVRPTNGTLPVPVDGKRVVFCEFYYSDDNGMTWTKSETDSWNFGGGDENNISHFGECKILECDDGSLRCYNSWNPYGCVVYSESFDGGVTWGKLKKIPELVCGLSSMQFCRDPYADNETTYYMVWVYSPMAEELPMDGMTRSRLCLARSTDGKSWEFLGDLWRWEHRRRVYSHLAHVVDAFVMTTKDHVICGAGLSEHAKLPGEGGSCAHHAQRQHIYSIPKEDLKPRDLTEV